MRGRHLGKKAACASGAYEGGSEGAITEATRDSVREGGSDLDLYVCDGYRRAQGRGGFRGAEGRGTPGRPIQVFLLIALLFWSHCKVGYFCSILL